SVCKVSSPACSVSSGARASSVSGSCPRTSPGSIRKKSAPRIPAKIPLFFIHSTAFSIYQSSCFLSPARLAPVQPLQSGHRHAAQYHGRRSRRTDRLREKRGAARTPSLTFLYHHIQQHGNHHCYHQQNGDHRGHDPLGLIVVE